MTAEKWQHNIHKKQILHVLGSSWHHHGWINTIYASMRFLQINKRNHFLYQHLMPEYFLIWHFKRYVFSSSEFPIFRSHLAHIERWRPQPSFLSSQLATIMKFVYCFKERKSASNMLFVQYFVASSFFHSIYVNLKKNIYKKICMVATHR